MKLSKLNVMMLAAIISAAEFVFLNFLFSPSL